MEILTELECIIRSEISNNVFVSDDCLFVQFPNNTMAIISQKKKDIQHNVIKEQKHEDKKTINNYVEFIEYFDELIKTDYDNCVIENGCITIFGEKLYLKNIGCTINVGVDKILWEEPTRCHFDRKSVGQ